MTTRSQRAVLASVFGACIMATAGLAIAGSAAAQPDNNDGSISIHVSYADLNLRSTDGAREMLSRIEGAATKVCGQEPEVQQLEERSLFKSCKAYAVGKAVRDLDAPMVTAMAGRESGTLRLAGR
jgi:UrcA family protein